MKYDTIYDNTIKCVVIEHDFTKEINIISFFSRFF